MEWTYGNLVGQTISSTSYTMYGIISALVASFPSLTQDFPNVFNANNDFDFFDRYKNRYLKFEILKDKYGFEGVREILNILAEKIYLIHGQSNWQRLKELYSTKYDQLNPFNLRSSNKIIDTQTLTKNSTKRVDNGEETTIEYEFNNYNTQTDDLTENFNHTTESDVLESKVAAFNTTAYSNDRKDERSNIYNDEKKNSGTRDVNLWGDEKTTNKFSADNSETNTSSDTANGTKDITTSRYGNIGNIPHQELFLKELEVLKHTIYETIFEDIASAILRESYCD